MATRRTYRKDELGEFRAELDRNRKKIYAAQSVCGICGRPVDFTLRYPDPMSKTVDHIVPINRGGHPSDLANLQLAHLACNRAKSDKLTASTAGQQSNASVLSNRALPQSADWSRFRAR